MAQGDGAIYNNFKEQVMEGVFNLATGGHQIQVTLHTGYSPNIDTHTVWGDAGVSSTEYGPGVGYASSGVVLTGQDVTQENTPDQGKFDATDATWTSLGPLSPATPSHAIMWDQTASGDPLIAYWELGTTATNGGNYTLQWGANGIILLT
jgi:hypothetical protein